MGRRGETDLGNILVTYEAIADKPAPMSWTEYEARLQSAWQALLDSDPSECVVQSFLEKHPCLLPGVFNMGTTSGHYPYPDAVISQPPLAAVGSRVPDFMWLSTNSIELEPVLIELERPSKKWFTQKGNPSANLTQAHNQLAQWRAWFAVPANIQVFYEEFQIPLMLRSRKLRVSCVLIYGRRHEMDENPRLNQVRGQMARENEYLMTYDRLHPRADASELYTVRKQSDGYKALAFPPTYVLRPGLADRYLLVSGKSEAIDRTEWMSASRKEFIKARFPYWEGWVRTKGLKLAGSEVE